MAATGMSSEQAFERIFARNQSVNKHQFSEAITKLKGVEFSAPEVDLLFKYFDSNKDAHIDFEEWTAKIYEDSTNALALIREVIHSSGIDSDELLHKMGL